MTHLNIEQNRGTRETVASNVVKKLYDLAKEIELDANGTIALKGWLYTSATYLNYITYLLNISKVNDVPLLTIDAGKEYIWFEDPEVRSVLASEYGDSVGVVLLNMFAITELRYNLFYGNTIVTQFNELGLFQSIKKIGSECFKGASNLLSIDLSNITQIGDSAFLLCSNLENIIFADSAYSYNVNTGYIEISIPVTSIGGTAFLDCKKLFKTTTFGQITAKIHLILNNCTNLGFAAFNDTGISAISIPNITSLGGSDQFNGCSNLEYINIPNVTSISNNTFKSCSNLSTVVLSNLITEIGTGAFQFTALSGPFTIPATVTSIGSAAFANNNMSCLIFEGSTPPSTLGNWGWPNIPVYVPNDAVQAYLTAFAAATNDLIKNNIHPISDYNPS